MVNAIAGALITCDVPTKEYLLFLNEEEKARNSKGAFVIKVLDDTHLLVKEDKVEYVTLKVKEFNNSHVYNPPDQAE